MLDNGHVSYLHVFDMDGTLITGTSANLEIARACGTEPELLELERRFSAGEIDTREFSLTVYDIWSDLTSEHVDRAFASSPFIAGITDVCADIRARGERSLVITMSSDFYARRLRDFGFDEVVASAYPEPPFAGPPVAEDILTPTDKVRIVDEVREREGIALPRCVAYGDSRSDGPLFQHLHHSVAVNADHHLSPLARAEYRGGNLLEAYRQARLLLAA